jgi:hypothetical protein
MCVKLKALLYTSDPYEPSGVIGLFETEEQKQNIVGQYKKDTLERYPNSDIEYEVSQLVEIEIPIGIYGVYY